MVAVRNLGLSNFHVWLQRLLRIASEFSSKSVKWLLRYRILQFSKWRPSAILDVLNLIF